MEHITLNNISFSYGDFEKKSLNNINLKINKGEVVLLCGASGCGKSTLLQIMNGVLPEQKEGKLTGNIYIDGQDASKLSTKERSKYMGSVFQNPKTQFFHLNTTDELYFSAANHLVSLDEMKIRLNNITQDFNIKSLLDRNIFMLSGGEKQKIACASVAMNYPQLYLLDEPSSNLDQKSIEELKDILKVLKEQGASIVIAEHRLYYALQICDKVCYMQNGEIIQEYSVSDFMKIDDCKRRDMGLRSFHKLPLPHITNKINNDSIIIENLNVVYGNKTAISVDNLELPKHQIIAITGENGVGKSSFVNAFTGLLKTKNGLLNKEKLNYKKQQKDSFMVMQDVNSQLYCESVIDELIHLTDESDEIIDQARHVLEQLNLLEYQDEHPMILSGGQKQRLAIATALFLEKKYVIFDEPTSGLDYDNMIRVSNILQVLKNKVELILVITHDMELIQNCADFTVNFTKSK